VLIIIVLVLLAIALWQLTKIFDLTQVGSDLDDSQVASDDDNNFQGYLMFGFSLYIHIYNLWSVYMVLLLILLRPRMVLKLTIL
jgi:cytochrome c oxidase subunit 2